LPEAGWHQVRVRVRPFSGLSDLAESANRLRPRAKVIYTRFTPDLHLIHLSDLSESANRLRPQQSMRARGIRRPAARRARSRAARRDPTTASGPVRCDVTVPCEWA
jgi:hypothetical protein